MIPEKMLELLLLIQLENLCNNNLNFSDWAEKNYNVEAINNRYLTLMKEFLSKYAKSSAEKSD